MLFHRLEHPSGDIHSHVPELLHSDTALVHLQGDEYLMKYSRVFIYQVKDRLKEMAKMVYIKAVNAYN